MRRNLVKLAQKLNYLRDEREAVAKALTALTPSDSAAVVHLLKRRYQRIAATVTRLEEQLDEYDPAVYGQLPGTATGSQEVKP